MQHIAGLGTFNQLREHKAVVIRRELTLLRFGMVLVFRSQVRETHSSPVGFCQAKVLRCGVARFFFRVFLISIIGRQGRPSSKVIFLLGLLLSTSVKAERAEFLVEYGPLLVLTFTRKHL